jgi:hypothetical protein
MASRMFSHRRQAALDIAEGHFEERQRANQERSAPPPLRIPTSQVQVLKMLVFRKSLRNFPCGSNFLVRAMNWGSLL